MERIINFRQDSNKEMNDNEKLELLYDIETQFKFTEQDKIPMNDIEARMMKGKKRKLFSCL